jgi:DNA-binding IscR family transcriptional regulator
MSISVQDSRRFSFFIIDNEILDNYHLSSFAILAYISIARCSKNGSCSFSAKYLAEQVGICRATFCKVLLELEAAGLVSIESIQGEKSIYTLLPVTKHPSTTQTPPVYETDTHPSTTQTHKNTNEQDKTIVSVYDHYISKTGRNPKLYAFSQARKEKLTTRFHECLKKTDGDPVKAVELMKLSIDGCLANKWWSEKGLNDLVAHIFKSYEQMEKWWND